ncbi:hypothetical protein SCYAM73S_07825 [Streptomyces cyaneofuscatus]
MVVHGHLRRGAPVAGRGAPGEADQPHHGGVQHRLIQGAVPHGGHDLGVGAPPGAGHLEVQTRAEGGHPVAYGSPVGHDDAVEPPLGAQDVGQQPGVLREGHPVDAVVGGHHGPGAVAADDAFEGAEVDLAQRALVDVGADPHPVGLLVVGRVVLECRAHTGLLEPAHHGPAQLGGEQRVLGEVLEVAPAERRALDVDARTQQHPDAVRGRLVRERSGDAMGELRVPAAAECHGGRVAGGGGGAVQVELASVARLLRQTQSVRPVGKGDGRDTGPVHGRGDEVPAAAGQGCLLGQGQRRGRGVCRRGRSGLVGRHTAHLSVRVGEWIVGSGGGGAAGCRRQGPPRAAPGGGHKVAIMQKP